MKCIICDADIPDDSQYCQKCGKKVNQKSISLDDLMEGEVRFSDDPEKFIEENRTTFEKALQKNNAKAEKILSDPQKIDKLLKKIEKTCGIIVRVLSPVDNIPILSNAKKIVDDIPKLIWLVRDYKNKRYREIPYASIVAIVAAFIYIVSPIDLIPDVVPLAGWLDDIAVVSIVLNIVSNDLDDYWDWHLSYGFSFYEDNEEEIYDC